MILSRRSFLATAASFAIPPVNCGPTALKHWVWIPTNLRRTADEWKQRFALMRASGVRAILPEVYAGREAYFQSARLPLKTDWLGTILPLARAEDVEVHAWMWCMPCMIPDMLSKHPDWYNVNANGESASDKPAYVPYYKFMDPGRPEVREFVQETLKELASIPELTGVHLDYIRHPDAILPTGLWKKYNIVQDRVYPPYDYGYTDYERARFREKYGADPMKLKSGQLEKEWLQFRLDMVTGLVNDYLVPAAHAKRKMITAAVFPGPSLARTMVRQDWGKWKLDAFLPMLYNTFYEAGPEWVGRYTREGVASVKKPVYSGVFAGGMDDAALSNVMDAALSAGASGISIFSDGAMTETKWKALKSASVRRT